MSNFWLIFSTDISETFNELSGNIIFNLNNLNNFNGNLIDLTSNFTIHELDRPVKNNEDLKSSHWNVLSLNTILSPFHGYWLGRINLILPKIFENRLELLAAVKNRITNPIPPENIYGNISNWNVGNVINMSLMFADSSFNGNISNWNVKNVTNMNSMFADSSFNGNISNWNVGNVTNMGNLFYNSDFNQDISNWNVGKVTNMEYMFYNAINFNQDISNWNVGNVIPGNFIEMFGNVTYFTDMSNQIHDNGTPFNYFDSQKQIFVYTFDNYSKLYKARLLYDHNKNSAINDYGYINNWDVGNVTNMNNMFNGSDFSGNISNWDVGNVKEMVGMFANSDFNGNISNWNVGNVINMSIMFNSSKFNNDINNWNVGNVTNMSSMFNASVFTGIINNWDVKNVRDMSYMFDNSLFKIILIIGM